MTLKTPDAGTLISDFESVTNPVSAGFIFSFSVLSSFPLFKPRISKWKCVRSLAMVTFSSAELSG